MTTNDAPEHVYERIRQMQEWASYEQYAYLDDNWFCEDEDGEIDNLDYDDFDWRDWLAEGERMDLEARVAELEASVLGIYEYAEVYVRAMGPRMPADGAAECASNMNRAARAVGRAEQFAITHGMLTYTEGKHDENTPATQPPPGA